MMTDAQKEKIRYWRMEGLGYGGIAARLGLSENTVKSFCNSAGKVRSRIRVLDQLLSRFRRAG